MEVPVNHPRKGSLDVRHRLVSGFESGVVASAGLIAHGRGEAFDYLLGEKTSKKAMEAVEAAVAMLFLADEPVISVNGNVAALCPKEVVKLADIVGAKIEVNLFYRSRERLVKIRDVLLDAGAAEVYGVDVVEKTLSGLDSERAKAEAQIGADVVLVMLEDGDRTEALKRMGKSVIAIDLNPLSRTAQQADITVVDNIVRALPKMVESAEKLKYKGEDELKSLVLGFDNLKNLSHMEDLTRLGL
jgi:4-phosphopantoate---beta-alanine ligase